MSDERKAAERIIANNGSEIYWRSEGRSDAGELADAYIARLAADERQAEVMDRDALGRRVREVWIEWARRQPSPKPSWLVPYDDLSESDKEADRCIGAAIWGDAVASLAGQIANAALGVKGGT